MINGWLHSGDVGEINPANNSLRIVDRAKNIFKLSQGEYIAPEKLENVYIQSEYILQAWIYGDSLRDFIVMFAVIDPEKAQAFGTVDDKLMENDEYKNKVYEDIIRLADANKFNSLEKPKQFVLLKDPWTTDDLLTPTMKTKRNIAKEQYKDLINMMYEKGPIKK